MGRFGQNAALPKEPFARVIGDRHAAGAAQLGDVGQLLPFLATRYRTDRVDPRQIRLGAQVRF